MRIATWNINSVRVRLEHLLDFLKRQDVDTILLQEVKCTTEAFPKEVVEDAGYNCLVFGQKSYNGVAILSKHRMECTKFGSEVFEGDEQARYVEAFVGGFTIASVYVPNGQDVELPAYPYKLKFLKTLRNYLSHRMADEKFIIGGDFNIARADIDVYNPKAWHGKVCCTDAERELFQDILDTGLHDTHRELVESETAYTWWDYRHGGFAKNYGLRLDYLLATSNVKVERCTVDLEERAKERPSDHAPVIADVE